MKKLFFVFAFFIAAIVLSAVVPESYSSSNVLSVQDTNNYPTRIAMGPGGNLYVSDAKANAVFIYDTQLQLTGELKNLDRPLGLAVDSYGNIFVGNNGRDNVEIYSSSGSLVRIIDQDGIQMPNDLLLDRSQNLYVVDSAAGAVKVYDTEGLQIKVLGEGDLYFPVSAVIVNAATPELHVADQGSARIKVFTLGGTYLRVYGEQLITPDNWQGKFKNLQSIDVDASGRVHVLDSYAHRVQILNAETGTYIDAYGAFGTDAGSLNTPLDILVSNDSRVIAANTGNRIVASVHAMSLGDRVCSDDSDCPYLYNCGDNGCELLAQALPSPYSTTTIPPNDGTTSTVPPGDGPDPDLQPLCAIEQLLGPGEMDNVNALRSFRDKRLNKTNGLIAAYYLHGNEAATIIASTPGMQKTVQRLAAEILPSMSSRIEAGTDINISAQQYNDIMRVLDRLQVRGGPGLRNTVSRVARQIKSGKLLKAAGISISAEDQKALRQTH